MLMKVLCVRDSALVAYGRPFVAPATGAAVRSFSDEVNNPQTDFFKHPADYELFLLGDYDDSTAKFDLFSEPRSVARAIDLFREGDIPSTQDKSLQRVK